MVTFIKILTIILILQSMFIAQEDKTQISITNDAISEANDWLKIVDEKYYGQSWEEASKLFKNALTKEQWEKTLNGLLPPFGKVISRKVESSNYVTSLPGAPDGEYVVIVYKTKFENKNDSYETVIPQKEDDGEWRVSGYFIK